MMTRIDEIEARSATRSEGATHIAECPECYAEVTFDTGPEVDRLRADTRYLLGEVRRLRAAMPSEEEIVELRWMSRKFGHMGGFDDASAPDFCPIEAWLARVNAVKGGEDV